MHARLGRLLLHDHVKTRRGKRWRAGPPAAGHRARHNDFENVVHTSRHERVTMDRSVD